MVTIAPGDCRAVLPTLPDESVQCVVTSPPYWGLRDYGVAGQLGLEPTPEAYVAAMVGVFREVRRVLRDDGTLWLNLGDSYASGSSGDRTEGTRGRMLKGRAREPVETLKPKDLVGMPWRLAFALPGLQVPEDDVVTEGNALVADLDVRAGDQLPHLAARLAAERAAIVHRLRSTARRRSGRWDN
jgi:DNA methylase